MNELLQHFNLNISALGHLTSIVQLGFILGTLVFAILSIADRFSPSKVFFICALLGATFNLAVIWDGNTLSSILFLRFLTGFFLAGIYPVGMKIAADYYQEGLGKSLGLLVGALILGTAFPHLAKDITQQLPWKSVLIITSILAILGGFLMFFLVPNGPYRKAGAQLKPASILKIFRNNNFRSAAFGYFGHMWELYAFWAFIPFILIAYSQQQQISTFNIPLLSFFIIGLGGLVCMLNPYFFNRIPTKKLAAFFLFSSGICCIVSPIFFHFAPPIIFITFLLLWGIFVVGDSPQLSTLVAQNAEAEIKGTALTIVNCIGFTISIFSIQLLNTLQNNIPPMYIFIVLAIGPILGLLGLYQNNYSKISN